MALPAKCKIGDVYCDEYGNMWACVKQEGEAEGGMSLTEGMLANIATAVTRLNNAVTLLRVDVEMLKQAMAYTSGYDYWAEEFAIDPNKNSWDRSLKFPAHKLILFTDQDIKVRFNEINNPQMTIDSSVESPITFDAKNRPISKIWYDTGATGPNIKLRYWG